MSQQQLDSLLQMMKAQPVIQGATVQQQRAGLSKWVRCSQSTPISSANR